MRRSLSVAGFVALGLVGSACDKLRPGGAGAKPPFETFAPGVYHPPIKAPDVAAPEGIKKPWRVEVLQTDPRPFKNPRWKTIPIEAAGELEMPAGSSFRCLYNPLRIEAQGDEKLKDVMSWDVEREVWCSNDGWKTHTGAVLIVRYDATGTTMHALADQAELALYEVIGGRPTKTSILLRAD